MATGARDRRRRADLAGAGGLGAVSRRALRHLRWTARATRFTDGSSVQPHPDESVARVAGTPALVARLVDPTEAPMDRARPTLIQRAMTHPDLVRSLAMLIALVAAMAVLTVVFGVTHPAPGYESFPDPAAGLGF